MLVEVHTKSAMDPQGISTFMHAEVTDQEIEDVRAMHLEERLRPSDHLDLWKKIPDVVPMDPTDILRPVRDDEVMNKECEAAKVMKLINTDSLLKVPKWEWNQIFNLLDKEA